jgi:two-component system phosphate regulon sensor histidine kinase PhoR
MQIYRSLEMLRAIWNTKHTLSTRLIAAFVAIIFSTTLAVGLPAYWIVRDELNQQAWARVEDAKRLTLVSLENQREHLENLAILAAQRPSLQELLIAGDTAALTEYLNNFQSSLASDRLAVYDPMGEFLASGSPADQGKPDLSPGLNFSYSGDDLVLVATQRITDNQTNEHLGFVTLSRLLDENFAQQLAQETGFEQSIIWNNTRAVTSLPQGTHAPVDREAVEQALQSGKSQTSQITIGDTRYYTSLVPLLDQQHRVVALAEVDMPIDNLVQAEQRALFALLLSTILVAVIGSALGAFYARRLASPLRSLTEAADQIGRGNLETPVPHYQRPAEIATLAAALEESRVNTCRTLEELSHAKEWSETLIRSITEGVITFDTHGIITFFSQGAERITRWSSEKALGHSFSEVLQLAESDTAQLMNYIPMPGSRHQMRLVTQGERPLTLAVTGARLIPPNSNTVQVVLVLRDITDEEISRNLHSYFLANISHEFRTPLAGLNASIELLLDEAGYLSPDEMDELLNSIHLSTSGLQALVDNLLESVNIEGGHFSIRRRPVEFNQVLASAIRVMQPLLDRRQQSLSLSAPLLIPPFEADPTRLSQVLINLISNASKYGPLNSTIDLAVEQVDNHLRISVADRGPGIAPADRAALFHRFLRLSTQSTDQYGIGLGLSVVKAIIEGHGGVVGVDERPGGGSIFWFTIPLQEISVNS